MADDFASRIIAAHQAGLSERRAEEERVQRQEDRKLQQQILKHQVERLKIQDLLEARQAAIQNAQLMQGQPAPEVTAGNPRGTIQPEATIPEGGSVAPIPSPIPAGFTKELRLPAQTIPGIPDMGIADTTIQPQSLQEHLRQLRGEKLFESQLKRSENQVEIPPIPALGIGGGVIDKSLAPTLIGQAGQTVRQTDQQKFAGGENEANRKAASGRAAAAIAAANSRANADRASREAIASANRIAAKERAEITATNKPPTEGERRAFSFYERITGAERLLDQMAPEITKVSKVRLTMAPNVLQSELGRNFNQAAGDFINAALRRESGAAISPSEYDRFSKLYFPQPGDTDVTLKQKAGSRKLLISALRAEAGRAYTETYSAPDGTKGGEQRRLSPDGKTWAVYGADGKLLRTEPNR